MTSLQLFMLIVYGGGVVLFLALLAKLFRKGKAEELKPESDKLGKLASIERETEALLKLDRQIAVQTPPLHFEVYPQLLSDRIGTIALDINLGLLEATRSSEQRLSKAAAEELLGVLRDELAMPKADAPPEQMVQSVRARLIRLTEMMVEAQLGLCDLDHRVVDVESIVRQLPEVLNSHRDGLLTLKESIKEIRTDYATKLEVKSLEKDLEWLKWTFTGMLGVILVILGFLLTKL